MMSIIFCTALSKYGYVLGGGEDGMSSFVIIPPHIDQMIPQQCRRAQK
jgi:hypothetical protein